ncbi:glutamate receptor [Klebsormidium nitens]|uniref:Glutamate receptor n=1 Tax=Klebsormidium nitens TaxID=105231 RepID=A0A1Y1HT70_KLENI|nr:glutamate receptor [Klebsormidium nitens]|eukprot:GAQ81814.1 glutamate receptor [Klebsormidium nitens]
MAVTLGMRCICFKHGALLVMAVLVQLFQSAQARVLDYPKAPNETYTVCTVYNIPYSTCDLGSTDSSTYGGYAVKVFEEAASKAGWSKDDYTWECLDYDPLQSDILNSSIYALCDVTAADMQIRPDFLAEGVQFAYPDFHNNLAVMVYAKLQQPDGWIFTKPFAWQVWGMLIVAALAVSLGVHLVEVLSKQHTSREVRAGVSFTGEHGLFESMWMALGQIVQAASLTGISLASRLIILVWCFMILLLLTMYTGNAAALLTIQQFKTTINTRYDLRGKSFGAWEGDAGTLTNFGLLPTLYPWNNDEDFEIMLGDLQSGKIVALVLDIAVVQYLSSTDCNYHLQDQFASMNYATAFWPGAHPALVANLSAAILDMEVSGELDRLQTVHFTQGATCSVYSATTKSVTFSQVFGLWVVLAVAIVFAIAISLINGQIAKRKYVNKLTSKVMEQWNAKSLRGIKRAEESAEGTDVESGDASGKEIATMKASANDGQHVAAAAKFKFKSAIQKAVRGEASQV